MHEVGFVHFEFTLSNRPKAYVIFYNILNRNQTTLIWFVFLSLFKSVSPLPLCSAVFRRFGFISPFLSLYKCISPLPLYYASLADFADGSVRSFRCTKRSGAVVLFISLADGLIRNGMRSTMFDDVINHLVTKFNRLVRSRKTSCSVLTF